LESKVLDQRPAVNVIAQMLSLEDQLARALGFIDLQPGRALNFTPLLPFIA